MLQITPEGKNNYPGEKVKISPNVQNYARNITVGLLLITCEIFASYMSITIND